MAKRKTLVKEFEVLVKEGNEEALKKVFDQCDINAYGGYNKGNALEFQLSKDMMKWLIEQGADIEYVDDYGYTPLLYHAGHGFAEEQALSLIELGADIHYTDELYKENALHKAVRAGSLELVKRLVEAGADVEAANWHNDNPLESAFHSARVLEIIRLEPVAAYLISKGVPVTERLQGYMTGIGKDIEFRRKNINKDYIEPMDKALNSLYSLFNVQPVERRVEYDGKSPIVVKEKTWQKQYGELWNLLVPGSGHANTIQGEVIRIAGKVSYEILDNGGINWDADYRELVKAFMKYVQMGNPLQDKECAELEDIIKTIKNADEAMMGRMTELAVKWIVMNTEPMTLDTVAYRR